MGLTDESSMPPSLGRAVTDVLLACRRPTGAFRLLPDFAIIGAQSCGSSDLYRHLTAHPCVAPALTNEVHFFDAHFQRGLNWYRAHFPLRLHRACFEKALGRPLITGEASPCYLFHAHAARRIAATIPEVRLIILLRNPVDRAYSHYQREVRLGFENLSFAAAVAKEQERVAGEAERMLADENYCSFSHEHYAYLARGIYVDQLRLWRSLFPGERILILMSEDLDANPAATMDEVHEFLGLPRREFKPLRGRDDGRYPPMNPTVRKRLQGYFEPHNQRLYEYLGVDLGWDG